MFRQIVSRDSLKVHVETNKKHTGKDINDGSKKWISNESEVKECSQINDSEATDKMSGFKKLARNILFSNDHKEIEAHTNSSNERTVSSGHHKNIKNPKGDYSFGRRTARKMLSDWFNDTKKKTGQTLEDEDFAVKEKLLLSKLIEANLGKLSNISEENNFKKPDNHIVMESGHVLKTNLGVLNRYSISSKDTTGNDLMSTFRTVTITNIPERTSIPSILAQIHGGPLSKLFLVSSQDWKPIRQPFFWRQHINWQRTAIRLEFSTHMHALSFWKYSKSGSFLVNGHKLEVFYVPNYPVKSEVNTKQLVQTDNNLIASMKEPECARRVLVLKKPIQNKRRFGAKKHYSYPDPNLNYSSDFKIENIIKDFSVFGDIVEVTPVISRKLCFGVQFFDTNSAIEAKKSIEGNGEFEDEVKRKFSAKYNDWYVWYGKDPTDSPIIC